MARLPQSLACLLLASIASAQYTIENLSFGSTGVISPSGHGIPGWHASSVNHDVQIFSDHIILTPPVPGHAKGALWSEARASSYDWTAQIDFRANGQELGSGNLNIWYTNDRDQVGVNSAYNAEKFDGLVLVVDQYGGSGGKIRGFLNDGTQNFRTHSSLESLAFGHCDYPYRNRGEYSRLKIDNTNGLTVSIDGRTCFSTDKVSMPQGYHFGVTASTGENPDSFEISKFVVTAGAHSPVTNQANMGSMHNQQGGDNHHQQSQMNHKQSNSNNQPPQIQKMDAFPGAPSFTGDRNAEEIKSQIDQFADLHDRVQNIQHSMATLFVEFKAISDKLDSKQSEMLTNIQNIKGSKESGLPPEIVGRINRMSDKIESMERVLEVVKHDTADRDYKQLLHDLHVAVDKVHGGLTEGLPDRIIDSKFEYGMKLHVPILMRSPLQSSLGIPLDSASSSSAFLASKLCLPLDISCINGGETACRRSSCENIRHSDGVDVNSCTVLLACLSVFETFALGESEIMYMLLDTCKAMILYKKRPR